ncbi:MAG: AMP-binding protein [Bdellovibrionota bacterium]
MLRQCLIANAAANWGNQLALKSEDKSCSYLELEVLVQTATASLSELGIKQGTRTAVLIADNFKFVPIFFALLRLGAIVCPLNFKDQQNIINEKLSIVRSEVMLTDQESSFKATVKQISVSQVFKRSVSSPERIYYEANDYAIVVFTSGTSGRPKAVCHEISAFLIGAIESNARINFQYDDKWLLSLSTSSVAGLSIIFRVFAAGARLLVPRSFETLAVIDSLKANPGSWVSLVPTMLKTIYNQELEVPQLKAILLGGAPIDSEVIRIIKENNLLAFNCYGMSETAANVFCTLPEDCPDKLQTVGTSLGSTMLELIDDEIVFSGPRISKGWINDSGVFTASHGKYFTGDLGQLVDERLIITGRKDRMIISGGENIDPLEIENAAKEFPGVNNAAVIGIENKKWGQRPVLFIECAKHMKPDKHKLASSIEARLGKVKLPDKITLMDLLPTTQIGKVDYQVLKKLSS